MPSKSVKKTTLPVEAIIQNVVSEPTQAETPIVETQQVKQKGGKKPAKVTPVVETVTPVVETVTASPVVEATSTASLVVEAISPPLKVPTKRGGAKSKASIVAEPSVAVVASVDTVVASSEVAIVLPLVTKKRAPKAVKPVQDAGSVVEEQVGGVPKVKVVKKQSVAKKAIKPVVETDNEESTDRRIRSFKVKLPDKEEFEGRFTGLTPYQAANKALSKYFRETETPKPEITFLICESTRKSKKSIYTYIGKRYQLEVPVKYTIQDGREIVKNFKNSLKKVKKVDLLSNQSGGTATPIVVESSTA